MVYNFLHSINPCFSKKWSTMKYSLYPKLYDVLNISHVLKNLINFEWEIYIMSRFTKLSLINSM